MADEFMKEASAEAEEGMKRNEGGPFGAVIVRDGKIVGKGHNQVLKFNDPTCHAEMQAIRDACRKLGTYNLSGCTLYTSCYPCPMCMSAAIWADIKTVYYGNTAKDAAQIGFRDDYIYRFIEKGCKDKNVLTLREEDRKMTETAFTEFEQKQDKKIY
jgi:guanine deaminase